MAHLRPGVLVRADGADGTEDFTNRLTAHRVAYSVGFTLHQPLRHSWPKGMRVIRRERPQLRFDDIDGYRLTAFATNTRGAKLQDLELRHHVAPAVKIRIGVAKDTGLKVGTQTAPLPAAHDPTTIR